MGGAFAAWMLGLACACPDFQTAVTVAVEVGRRQEPGVVELRGWLAARLEEEGHELTERAHATVVLLVQRVAHSYVIELESSNSSVVIEHGPLAVVQLEALHHAHVMLDACPPERAPVQAPRSSAREPAASRRVSTPASKARSKATDSTTRRWPGTTNEVRVGVDTGLAWRGRPDAYVRGGLRLGRRRGPGAALSVSVLPSRGEAFRAVDTTLAVGPDLRVSGSRVAFVVGAMVGARVHTHVTELSRGGAVDWYAGLPSKLSLGRSGLRAHIYSEVFFTGSRLEYRRWARTAWGVRMGLGVTFGWRIL